MADRLSRRIPIWVRAYLLDSLSVFKICLLYVVVIFVFLLSYYLNFYYLCIYAFVSALQRHPSAVSAHCGIEVGSPLIKIGWSRL